VWEVYFFESDHLQVATSEPYTAFGMLLLQLFSTSQFLNVIANPPHLLVTASGRVTVLKNDNLVVSASYPWTPTAVAISPNSHIVAIGDEVCQIYSRSSSALLFSINFCSYFSRGMGDGKRINESISLISTDKIFGRSRYSTAIVDRSRRYHSHRTAPCLRRLTVRGVFLCLIAPPGR
jgi:hypothetical protein